MPYLMLGLILILVAIVLVIAMLRIMAHHLLTPPRMGDGKAMYVLKRLSPEDLGLAFEEITFTIRDVVTESPMRVAGWWIPAGMPSLRTVLILHGYSDAKVGGIAWAPVWRSLGWNVLAIDLRAHGESGGKHSTAGYYEREDVDQVIDSIRLTHPQATKDFAIFGVSLGAAVAAAVGARRDDLHAIILESPYTDYRVAIAAHGRRLAMPLEWGYGIACKWAESISGARFDQVTPLHLIQQIKAPLLVIHAGADTFVSRQEIEQIAQAVSQREPASISRHVLIDDVQHTRGLLADPVAYVAMLRDFLNSPDKARATL